MHLLRSFRFSTYLTLAMAVLCLGYAEGTLLPESPYITAAVILLIGVAYQLEGRWSLSLRAANFVGGALTLMLIGWIGLQFVRKPTEVVQHLPFPAFLLPYLSPVLMILIPAKLFRPKHNGDYWAMQGIGILAVALGCAMAYDMFFGVLLIVYMFCFAWSMSLFHLYRESRSQNLPDQSSARKSRTYLFRAAWRWSVIISAVGLLLFLVTPRPNDSKWELPMAMRGRAEVGLSEGNVDLNRTGTLEQNAELAFLVEARDARGAAKLDLDLNQRWRAASLVTYEGGKWMRGRDPDRAGTVVPGPASSRLGHAKRSDGLRLPDLGPQTYTLTFSLTAPTSAMAIAASPVLWRAVSPGQWRSGEEPPIHVFGPRISPVLQRNDGSFEWVATLSADRPSYVQAMATTPEPDLGPPMLLSKGYLEFLTRLPQSQVGERLRRHTSNLLARLVREGKLAAHVLQDVNPFTQLPAQRNHQAIARALERYLSSSGEFRYTTQLQRADRSLDPVEDFLYNTKSGHCQRFASALALMLRSQGIPAQLVLGFRGCEPLGDGRYEVRQYHAHAWVETIVDRSPPTQLLPLRLGESPPIYPTMQHWLSLDPTPAGSPEKDEKNGLSEWLEEALSRGENFFRNFVLGYDAAARQRTVDAIVNGFEEFGENLMAGEITWPIGIVGGCVLLIPAGTLIRGRLRRRRLRTQERAAQRELDRILPFHGKLLELLARHGLAPRTGQTAREFADAVATELSATPAAPVADVPSQLADAYYRARFGGTMPTEVELQDLDKALNRLGGVLTATRFQASCKTP